MNADETLVIDRSEIWAVDWNESPEEFEERIVATIERRGDTLRLAVDALID